MKRLAALLLALTLIISFAGCSGDTVEKKTSKIKYPSPKKQISVPDTGGININFLASDNGYFYRAGKKRADLFYIKGVNMGLTEATTDLNNCNTSYSTYMDWFTKIKQMNANTVRVFSVMNPNFYKALHDYNSEHKDNPLYLVQGIWFSEELLGLADAWESDEILITAFYKSIRETIDIVHGASDYTYYGEFRPAVYEWDISKYIVGYILGLEYPSEFVIETNASHPDKNYFNGKYLKGSDNISPFEAFLATVGEYLIDYETDNFSHQTPVAFLNWQPLDTIEHENEPYKEENDSVSVNTENITASKSYYPGLFAAVDVYPYYPEFMNHEPKYLSFKDEQGNKDTFRAYLRDLKAQYTVPLMIAEYGLSTSRGIAHYSVVGYNQGGLNEIQQGEMLTKMTRSIALEGCCGGLIFSFQDEWFKRTWNTVMYYPDDPTMRTQNLSSAEQGYGLLSFYTPKTLPDGDISEWKNTDFLPDGQTKVRFDVNYLHILIKTDKNFNFEKDKLYVPIQTTARGSMRDVDEGLEFSDITDFLLVINGKDTRLLCEGGQDVFHDQYYVRRKVFGEEKAIPRPAGKGNFYPIYTYVSNEMYLPVQKQTLEPQYYESGRLIRGNANPASSGYNSLADYFVGDGHIEIRIAWYLLNVVNSRTKTAVAELSGSEIDFEQFSTIRLGVGKGSEITLYNTGFDGIKDFTSEQRLKKSYYYVKDIFKEISIS